MRRQLWLLEDEPGDLLPVLQGAVSGVLDFAQEVKWGAPSHGGKCEERRAAFLCRN